MTVRVGVTGAAGRMGRMLIEAIGESEQGIDLRATIERPESALAGVDSGELIGGEANTVVIVSDLATVIGDIDVLIDFTVPAATLANAELCAAHGVAMVIGTTGFTVEQERMLFSHDSKIALCKASNFSTGVGGARR